MAGDDKEMNKEISRQEEQRRPDEMTAAGCFESRGSMKPDNDGTGRATAKIADGALRVLISAVLDSVWPSG